MLLEFSLPKFDADMDWSESWTNPDPIPLIEETFVEWDVKAPLDVICEEYEREEKYPNENNPNPIRVIERYSSLLLYYPESDSDSSSSETNFLAIGE